MIDAEIERCAGIDVGKTFLAVCVMTGPLQEEPHTEQRHFGTNTTELEGLRDWLQREGVTHVVMEASGVYTEPVYYALTELDFTEVLVVNPAHVKALRGHKTDARDAVRMLDLYECGAVMRGSYIPSPDLKEVRDLVRYRVKTVQARPGYCGLATVVFAPFLSAWGRRSSVSYISLRFMFRRGCAAAPARPGT